MTFSPIISTAGADPDSAAIDPAAAAVAPAAAVPDPAVAPDSGNAAGQPVTGTNHAGATPGQAGPPTGQATTASGAAHRAYPTGQATTASGAAHRAYPTGQATAASGAAHGAYPTGQATAASGAAHGAYPTGQATAEQGGHPATEQGGYSATEQGAYAAGQAGQGAYSAGQADQGAYSAGQGAYSTADVDGPAAGSARQDDAGTAWPHQTFLELGALPTAAPCARLHATLVLWEWDLSTLVRTAGLVVSELVSNAVQASVGLTGSRFAGQWAPGTPPVRVWLSADDHRVVIQVWDGSDRPPVPQPVEPEADRGRGLLLVGALSAEWGCYTPEKSSGKVVWAVVSD